ncbi:MAG: response regulator, partial [Proteobacteria bacterium]|nr:response regulator [Pseudomonadota bacterium]
MRPRICLLEDDPTIRELVAEKLVQNGYEVDSFSDAESLSSENIVHDLYILDVMLEGEKSGLQICDEIR